MSNFHESFVRSFEHLTPNIPSDRNVDVYICSFIISTYYRSTHIKIVLVFVFHKTSLLFQSFIVVLLEFLHSCSFYFSSLKFSICHPHVTTTLLFDIKFPNFWITYANIELWIFRTSHYNLFSHLRMQIKSLHHNRRQFFFDRFDSGTSVTWNFRWQCVCKAKKINELNFSSVIPDLKASF